MVKMSRMTGRYCYMLIGLAALTLTALLQEPYSYIITTVVGCVSYYIIDM